MTTYYETSDYYGELIHSLSHGSVPGLYDKEPESLEELQNLLIEFPSVSHVSVPYSWYGYGATHATLANTDYLEEHYSDVATSHSSLQWIVSREVILAGEHDICSLFDPEFWEGTMSLSDEKTSEREHEALLEETTNSLTSALWSAEIDYDDDNVREWLETRIHDYPEHIFIDNDGYTAYVSKSIIEQLAKEFAGESR